MHGRHQAILTPAQTILALGGDVAAGGGGTLWERENCPPPVPQLGGRGCYGKRLHRCRGGHCADCDTFRWFRLSPVRSPQTPTA